jgi:hypothetical protein
MGLQRPIAAGQQGSARVSLRSTPRAALPGQTSSVTHVARIKCYLCRETVPLACLETEQRSGARATHGRDTHAPLPA